MSTTARSTATSSGSVASSARSTASSSRSKRSMASDIDTATPEPGRRWFGLQGLASRIAAAFARRGTAPSHAQDAPSLLRRRRATRRYSPLTRRILLLNIIPVALLTLGAVYLSDYE